MSSLSKVQKQSYDETQEIFERFELQLTRCWLDRNDKQKKLDFAYHHLETLRAIENFVLDIEYENSLKINDVRHSLFNENRDEISHFQKYFNRLRFNSNWFTDNQILSERAIIFFDVCRRIEDRVGKQIATEQMATAQIKPRHNLLSMSDKNFEFNEQVDLEHKTDLLFELIDTISTKLESLSFKKKMRGRQIFANEQNEALSEYVQHCFDSCPQIFVVCMDLGYCSSGKNKLIKPTVANVPQILSDLKKLSARLDFDSDIVGHFEKLEFTSERGYSLHGAFLFKDNKRYTEGDWVKHIGDMWIQITQNNRGAYHNCNPEIRQKFSDRAVGAMKRTEIAKVEAMQKWVIGYMTLSSQYLAASREQYAFFIGKRPSIKSPVQLNAQGFKNNSDVTRLQLLSENEIKTIWKLSGKNLTVQLKEQLKVIPIVYQQIGERFKNDSPSQPLPQQSVELWNIDIEWLIKIETFVALVRESNSPAFDCLNLQNKYTPTRLGKQLLDLESKFDKDYVLEKLIPNLKYLSIGVKIFCAVISYRDDWYKPSSSEVETDQFDANFYNSFITEIRKYLQLDCQSLPQFDLERPFPPSKNSNLSVLAPPRYRFGKTVHLTPLDKPEINQDIKKIQAVTSHITTKAPNPTSKQKSISALITENHRIARTTYAKAEGYVKALFKQDAVLICIKLYLESSSKLEIPHDVFSKLFTSFMRVSKSCRPLAWRLGYIGRWECISADQQCAHVIFIMDADKIIDVEDSAEQIRIFWEEFIQNKKPSNTDYEGSVIFSPISNFHTEFNGYYRRIEIGDKALQKVFLEEILVYLTQSELYFKPNLIKFPKGLIKGNSVTANSKSQNLWKNSINTSQPRKMKARVMDESDSQAEFSKRSNALISDVLPETTQDSTQ